MRQLELPCEIIPSPEEEPIPATSVPSDYAIESASAKARAVMNLLASRGQAEDAIVIGADTIVCLDDAILGKPAGATEAAAMLTRLSGRVHTVYTGLALRYGEETVMRSRLHPGFDERLYRRRCRSLCQKRRNRSTKAGAYGIQGLGARFIERIEGCYYNVVGLPLARLCALLGSAGYHLNDKTIK